jgi:hypothetical protein
MHSSLGDMKNQKRVPSFRTVFFAYPESMFFNSLLDTGSSPAVVRNNDYYVGYNRHLMRFSPIFNSIET